MRDLGDIVVLKELFSLWKKKFEIKKSNLLGRIFSRIDSIFVEL